jgi:hypothetical protein
LFGNSAAASGIAFANAAGVILVTMWRADPQMCVLAMRDGWFELRLFDGTSIVRRETVASAEAGVKLAAAWQLVLGSHSRSGGPSGPP